jgi:DNA-binding PadR family transcriptional regulator
MSTKESHHLGAFYVIPSQVFEDDRLEYSEIMFYALLSGLANNTGYCFASDKYLAERMKISHQTIERWLLKLEEIGYIKRETKKNGLRWDRKIFITHARVNSNNVYEPSPTRARTLTHEGIVRKEIINKEDPPPQVPKKSDEPQDLVQMKKKMISLGWKEKEFDEAWKRFEVTPQGHVKNIRDWLIAVMQSIRDSEGKGKELEKRKQQAKKWDGKKLNQWNVFVTEEGLELTYGSFCKSILYSDEQWDEKTAPLNGSQKNETDKR